MNNITKNKNSRRSREKPSSKFTSASVVLPVINEVESLNRVVNAVFGQPGKNIREIIIVVCSKTTADSLAACHSLCEKYKGRIRILQQTLPFLGGALREGLAAVHSSHVVVMYSDGESAPHSIGALIREAERNPDAIISASRWLKESTFAGYSKIKYVLNYLFQKVFSLFYWTRVTDFTFGYRIYPVPLMQTIDWQETGHAFVFESIVKPLRLRIKIIEIPTCWRARHEGVSQCRPGMYLRYLWVGLKVRFSSHF